ncbi:ribosome silencing factor [Peptoniphilus sp. KCTC 25270]|uniref:ribosome silencing factor n=1 Tax=Peptoniphilus sp. KCTC 25270 TaxID=2897414 RepID=UPI001E28A411|nr:ribosome silencing factor [Peptoniphilus sp. KCTC 25270]MCD1146925.1 ribosome silencing factor [Peptoniphilus sp. KCTC 25270]
MKAKDSNKKLDIIIDSADNKKGINTRVLDIRDMSAISDYFVIVSGNSVPQIRAIADEIIDKMAENGYDIFHKEGNGESRWIILDFEDVIVHVFHREEREYYSLERLWGEERKEMNKEEEEGEE